MAALGRAALLLSFGLVVYALVAGSYAAWSRRRRLAVSAQNALLASFGTTLVITAFPANPATGTIYIYRSTDAGATWTYASTAPNPFQDVAFVTATRWLQISSPGDSKETTDGGAGWHAYATTYSQAVAIEAGYADAHYGLADMLDQLGRLDEACVHWRAYLQEEPTGIRAEGR